MIHPFNLSTLLPLLYIVVAIIVMLRITMKHEWFEGLTLILGLIWPLYYFALFLIYIFENHDDKKQYNKVSKKNFFDDTYEGRDFKKKHDVKLSVNTKGKARLVRTKVKNV
jgi:uncharacterized membrane protein YkvI